MILFWNSFKRFLNIESWLIFFFCCLLIYLSFVIQEKEKENWEATCESLKARLETAESSRVRAEIGTAKIKSNIR